MSNSNSSAVMTANLMLSEALYDDCIKFAKRIIYLEKANLFPEDIVHDLIIETNITYSNYQKKIKSKIISERYGFKPLTIESLYYVNPKPFKTNQDFTCTKCKDVFPDSERKRYFSSKGFFVEKNICRKCCNQFEVERQKKARIEKLPSWFKKLERERKNYNENKNGIRDKRLQRYQKVIVIKEKIDWKKEKEQLTDKYIIRLLNKRTKIAAITPEMILQKRESILKPKPKKTIQQIRKEWNEKRKIKYKLDLEYQQRTKKKVSEYAKANKEKRQQYKKMRKLSTKGF